MLYSTCVDQCQPSDEHGRTVAVVGGISSRRYTTGGMQVSDAGLVCSEVIQWGSDMLHFVYTEVNLPMKPFTILLHNYQAIKQHSVSGGTALSELYETIV